MLIQAVNLFAQNELQRTAQAIARSLQRLSSGSRVSTPADDIAAYDLSITLDAQARGFQQAILNANEGIGLVSTAESAFQTQLDILQKMHELALQASNGTYSTQDRANLNTEFQDLLSEFQRITTDTQFNGTKLLDGSFGSRTLQIGATSSSSDQMNLQIDSIQTNTAFQKTIGTGTFQAAASVGTAGSNPIASTVVDINHDGIPDFVVADNLDNNISIYLGNGNGTFKSRLTYAVASGSPSAVAVGDLNGDGIPDIVTNDLTTKLNIFIGNGDGTFKTATTISVGNKSEGLAIADFNHDGKMDIVEEDNTDGTISVLLGNGDGTFKTRTTYATGSSPQGLTIGDLNGDGNTDVIVANAGSNTVSVFLGNSDGTFQAAVNSSVGSLPSVVSVGDLNGDGKLDVIVGDNTTDIYVMLGNGDGTLKARTTIATTGKAKKISFADVNGDGAQDLVIADGAASVLLGNGDGTLKASTDYTVNATGAFGVWDTNGDGVSDIVTATFDPKLAILYGNSQSVTAASNLNLTTQSNAQSIVSILDSTINYLKKEQANVAAVHSRLEENVANNLLAADSLDQAKEKATNVDVALETSNLVRNQILQNGATAVLAQANLNEQVVLQLLKFQ